MQVSAGCGSASARPCAGRTDRHPSRWPVLVAARLRRTPGRATGRWFRIRAQLRRPAGDRHAGDGHLRNKIIDALPYALTSSQREAVAAIIEDLLQPVRMLRLLQGDVGSGKTVVALSQRPP